MKPILFNSDMVRAILDGRKTVTRRVIKRSDMHRLYIGKCPLGHGLFDKESADLVQLAPYHPGDILYVRETWQQLAPWDDKGCLDWDKAKYYYAADGDPDIEMTDDNGFCLERFKWRPSIHMPKEAARIFLRVTDVRVERLQDITSTGIEREGIELDELNTGEEYRYAFEQLWNTTIKTADIDRYGWASNPFVWVIEFERIEKGEAI